ncbi:MAG: phenylacetate--CoA ligase [Spirochaetes bacterium DG_61]|nr:MAG: phenylacetate--CoA ligase [Spirochaetes bacterium DG_61]
MPILNKKYETLSHDELVQVQLERLQQTLSRVYRRVSYYHNLFTKIEFDPFEISDLEDLKKIPFTTKDILRLAYPFDMFAVPLLEVVRMHSTSGTTGQPLVVGYTKNDIEHWTELTARILAAAGVTTDDIIQICFPYGLFTGGLGFHYGAEKIGASVIPSSESDIEHQIIIMKDYRTSALACTPSYAVGLAEVMREKGITPAELSLRVGLFGAEPWSEQLRKELEENLAISAFDNYGLTEIIGPGVSFECENKNGLHISEDHFIAEIIDPENGRILGPEEQGELVLTTVTKEAYPLIRYRTGDLTQLFHDRCSCGRTFVKMKKVSERIDDMIILNGKNMFPSQFEQILTDIIGKTPNFQLVVDRKDNIDKLEIQVEVSGDIFDDEMKKLTGLELSILKEVKAQLDFIPDVRLVEPRSIRRDPKKRAVIDKRKK